MAHETKQAIRIRATQYHGKDGFAVQRGARPWGTNIFVRTREAAETIRRALKLDDAAKSDAVIDSILRAGL